MLYQSLDDIPRNCEVPFENLEEGWVVNPQMNSEEASFITPETSVDNVLDWD